MRLGVYWNYSFRMAYRKTLLWGIVVTGLLVAAFQALATPFSLYWVYHWFDIPMHFLGGMFVAFLALWSAHGASERGISFTSYPYRRLSAMLLFVVLAALIVGIAWELFEVVTGMPRELNYQFDTALDLLLDVFGGVSVVGLLYAGRTWRTTTITAQTA